MRIERRSLETKKPMDEKCVMERPSKRIQINQNIRLTSTGGQGYDHFVVGWFVIQA